MFEKKMFGRIVASFDLMNRNCKQSELFTSQSRWQHSKDFSYIQFSRIFHTEQLKKEKISYLSTHPCRPGATFQSFVDSVMVKRGQISFSLLRIFFYRLRTMYTYIYILLAFAFIFTSPKWMLGNSSSFLAKRRNTLLQIQSKIRPIFRYVAK